MSVDSPCSFGGLTVNTLQKVILAVGGVLLLANLAYPPWELRKPLVYGAVVVARMERSFVMAPPPAGDYRVTCIDWSLLGVTSLAVVVATGVLFGLTVIFKKHHPK